MWRWRKPSLPTAPRPSARQALSRSVTHEPARDFTSEATKQQINENHTKTRNKGLNYEYDTQTKPHRREPN
jgi:hypothetical protein